MGGVILFFLFVAVLVILVSPAMRARGRQTRDEVERSAHEAVVRRLEDHRRQKAADRGPDRTQEHKPGSAPDTKSDRDPDGDEAGRGDEKG
jgi:flagellar biosynthesis/type III secretory pathway M-ring protein FliF/YscJ